MTETRSRSILKTVPPLENGDRLTRSEFERRYHKMPSVKKAELIEGMVYMPSPLKIETHGEPHAYIMTWLGTYKAATPGVGVADNSTVRLDIDNEPQPDALLRIKRGGNSSISEDGYVEGAPELIVEIAASSASYDLHEKLKVYRRNQVQEYLVWRVYDRAFDWFYLQEGEYRQIKANTDNIFDSQVFPGFWLAKSALLDGDLATVLSTLQQGLATVEHQTFIESIHGKNLP